VIVPQRPSAPVSLFILRALALAIIVAAITLAVLAIATA
jgi:hypothetical protein